MGIWELIIPGVIGLLSGGLPTLLFWPQIRKNKTIENESKQSEEWRKLYEEERQVVLSRDSKIDSLYQEINQHRDEKIEIRKRNVELEVENAKLRLLKCEVAGCPNRKPPTGF